MGGNSTRRNVKRMADGRKERKCKKVALASKADINYGQHKKRKTRQRD